MWHDGLLQGGAYNYTPCCQRRSYFRHFSSFCDAFYKSFVFAFFTTSDEKTWILLFPAYPVCWGWGGGTVGGRVCRKVCLTVPSRYRIYLACQIDIEKVVACNWNNEIHSSHDPTSVHFLQQQNTLSLWQLYFEKCLTTLATDEGYNHFTSNPQLELYQTSQIRAINFWHTEGNY